MRDSDIKTKKRLKYIPYNLGSCFIQSENRLKKIYHFWENVSTYLKTIYLYRQVSDNYLQIQTRWKNKQNLIDNTYCDEL